MTETPSPTRQSVESDSKEGKAFFKRVIRDMKASTAKWNVRSQDGESDEYRKVFNLSFHRTIKGEIGSPDVDVRVLTDVTVTAHLRDFGIVNQSDSEYTPVKIPLPISIDISYSNVIHLCDCILAGFTFSIEANVGSISSSRHGIAMVGVRARNRVKGYTVAVGHDSWIINGNQVCWGCVRCR